MPLRERKWPVAAAAAVAALCLIGALHLWHRAAAFRTSALQDTQHPSVLPSLAGSGALPGASPGTAGQQQGGSSCPPGPPACLFNTLLGARDVHWSTRNGTADRLSIRGCQLQRYNHREARQCLAGKRLVFVGDSVTRYQYLTLLYFLEKGEWPAPLGGVAGDPSVANEHEWPSWNDFLRGTNALFGGHELCDCFRKDAEGYKPPEDEKHENRYYSSGDISVSHFTYTTEPNKLHGHYGFPPYPKGRKPCKPATCDFPPDWAYDLRKALKVPMAAMNATHLVLNSGLWGSSNAFGEDTWRDIAFAGKVAVSAQEGRVFWRTTTANRGKNAVSRDADALALKHTSAQGWGVLDAYAITRPLLAMPKLPLWDGRHFLAVVYRELNLHLLNSLCNPWA